MFELNKIDNQRDEDANMKGDPKPNARWHAGDFHGGERGAIANCAHCRYDL